MTIEAFRMAVDVGGTFTDCLAQWLDGGESHQACIKVLSSGMIRCRVLEWRNAASLRVEIPKELVAGRPDGRLPDDFFAGTQLHALQDDQRIGIGDITAYESANEVVHFRRFEDSAMETFSGASVVEIDCEIEAPVLAARLLLGVPLSSALPSSQVRLGTTRGTNALLTRSGAMTGLVVTDGFGDLLEIGEQDRPELFDLSFQKPLPLARHVVQVEARMDAQGNVLIPLDETRVLNQLLSLKQQRVEALAICLMHSHVNATDEETVERLAREVGFDEISRSSEIAPLIKLVARAETTTLDAYLNPILKAYGKRLRRQFGGSHCDLQMMTSGGNLIPADQFRGRDSVLSGPAGGTIALGHLVRRSTESKYAIGLDMGGTSTDVSRFDGQVNRRYESRVAGLRILTPMMDIHTVAAGGGSICDVVGGRLVVGPDSAGASPGPACYGRGGPLTVTDVNLLMGRLLPDRFPFPLSKAAAQERLEHVGTRLEKQLSEEALAEGFLDIAVTHMAEAVRAITVARGVDAREHTLVGFGGAAAQHLCRVADSLGMSEIVDHPRSSVLSAAGIGVAATGVIKTVGVYRLLHELHEKEFDQFVEAAKQVAIQAMSRDEDSEQALRIECDCRYAGADTTLPIATECFAALAEAFHVEHQNRFGYRRDDRAIEWVSVRCELTQMDSGQVERLFAVPPPEAGQSESAPQINVWCRGRLQPFHLFRRETLAAGATLPGGSMVVSDHSTLIVEPNWTGGVRSDGTIVLHRAKPNTAHADADRNADDPIQLEITARRLQSVADSMGEVLRRTAVSVNVKERLDFSCAVFNADGALIASAPHVPVHLGAMGNTVRFLAGEFDDMADGDCYVSNDPYNGGSHLPDVTVVTPVFAGSGHDRPDFYVASRAHHAEIGGKTPGSMPPDARCLADEGVLIRAFPLFRNGESHEDELRQLLSSGKYPSRNVEENLADLRAQVAAGRDGAARLSQLATEQGVEALGAMMRRILQVAAESVSRWIRQLPYEPLTFMDFLDDGSKIAVRMERDGDRLRIDFSGTDDVHPGAFNATPAITTAAILYVVRCFCDSNLPLCDGAMQVIDLVVPEGMLSPPGDPDPERCAAVVAGNVETSQRIVDVLLGALGKAHPNRPSSLAVAASQGTMNNVLMGDATFGYYETIGGGSGATIFGNGASAVHTHMTNTRITDPEVVETRLPVRLWQFSIRAGSGGRGRRRGGDGIVREFEFLKPMTVSLITGRRTTPPYGAFGGEPGKPGENHLLRATGESLELRYSETIQVEPRDRLRIETPGGGGFGKV